MCNESFLKQMEKDIKNDPELARLVMREELILEVGNAMLKDGYHKSMLNKMELNMNILFDLGYTIRK